MKTLARTKMPGEDNNNNYNNYYNYYYNNYNNNYYSDYYYNYYYYYYCQLGLGRDVRATLRDRIQCW